MSTRVSPAERARIANTLAKWERELREASDERTQLMLGITVGEAVVHFMAENFGRKKTWEWLQRLSDELLKEDLPK